MFSRNAGSLKQAASTKLSAVIGQQSKYWVLQSMLGVRKIQMKVHGVRDLINSHETRTLLAPAPELPSVVNLKAL